MHSNHAKPRVGGRRYGFALIPALAMPGTALAHAGHGPGSFLTGFWHPIGGLDHVLAMVAVGVWAATTGGRAVWAAPLIFVMAMLGGGALGLAGLPVPGVEPMIMASIVILGMAVALAVRPPLALALGVIAVFGVAHGYAHGAEGPATGGAAFAAGFALATTLLHGAGLALGFGLARLADARVTRGLGTGILVTRILGAGGAVAGLAIAYAG